MTYPTGVRALLVVNPHATATTAAGRDVLAHALASDVKLEVLQTSHRGHAADAAARAATDGVDLVVAHGGDGTVNEVVNGLMSVGLPEARRPMLGVVPGGSANVFAGALGLPRDPVEATYRLLRAIETGGERRIGLGRADGRWFTFSAGIGWDAEVVAAVDSRRRKEASPALYVRTALGHYLREALRRRDLTVEIPGEEPVSGVRLAMICNADPWTYLGPRPIRLVPNSSFDEGLGVYALRSLATPTVIRHITQLLRKRPKPHGKHLLLRNDVSSVRVTSSQPFRVQVDGDLLGERRSVDFTSVAAALRVAV